ncbi:replication protein A 32 kDa subunit-like [Sinocyclocheilus grahami]|uniref:replication protein A 32 kDa subunit-like n=1 Tax=Sinocyclocheilus grahami TaxID=75366 RepID=UPI0007AD3C50|nr:PREDICTED: replication protein A 32 kDa subunit-like [Sinocyclocheilus grahami]
MNTSLCRSVLNINAWVIMMKQESSSVTIVGVTRSTDKCTISIQYKVDDMTAAPMDVKQWIDTENNCPLVAFSVRVLEDMNEVTSHMLEVVNAHVQQSKPQKTKWQIVDFLSNEGHIFSTIDEDHFRSTDNEA